MYDVFVSYSHRDKDWVRGYLLPVLSSWKLAVAIDHVDFLPGQRLIRNISDFIRDSRHVLFVCTGAFLQSEWCREELETARSSDPGVMRQKAIPVVLERAGVPDLLSTILWCDLERNQSDEDEWRKLCKALRGTWTDESSQLINQLFDVAGFFGGFLNNSTKTYVVARSHGSRYQGVQAALGIETANSFANVYAMLSRYGKSDGVELVLSDDGGEMTGEMEQVPSANYIAIGGTTHAEELILTIARRQIRYISGETNHYYVDGVQVEIKKDRLSFLIYKTATSIGNNIIYLFSPWAIGSFAAAKTLNEWSLEFAKVEHGNEFLHIFESGFSEHAPVLSYRHEWRLPLNPLLMSQVQRKDA